MKQSEENEIEIQPKMKKNCKPSTMCAIKIENWCLWVYQQSNQAGNPHSCVLTTIWHATMLSLLLPTLTTENSQFHANKKKLIFFLILFSFQKIALLHFFNRFLFFFVIFIIAFLFFFLNWKFVDEFSNALHAVFFYIFCESWERENSYEVVDSQSWLIVSESKWVRKMVDSAIIKECRFDTNQ